MADTHLKDEGARNRIGPWQERGLPSLDAFEKHTNFVVRAAAGSGKTTALVGRMLALVRTGTPVEQIAAITFTKKAAGEMQARFYEELMAARAAVESESAEETYIQRALDNLPNCFIGTIHSFCQELLRKQPEAANVAKGFTTLEEDREKDELQERFWQAYLNRSWTERRAAIDALVEAGVEMDELTSFFGTLADQTELDLYVDGPHTAPELDAAVEQVRAFYEEWRPYVPDTLPDVRSPCTTAQAFKEAERYLAVRALDTPITQAEFLSIFAGLTKDDTRKSTDTEIRGDVTPTHWGDHKEVANRLDNELLVPLVKEVVEPALRDWNAFVHRRAAAFVEPAVEAYRQHRWANGQLTFTDLLVAARNLLRENPDVRERLQTKYQHVLVDEFQDTDPIQAEVLFYLTGRNTSETNWRQCDPRPGSLFIVGDDKQSIYGFRQADMAVFETVGRLIDDQAAGEAVDLVSNFRSAERICTWCDAAFGALFANDRADAPDRQAEYVAFESTESVPSAWAPVRQLTVPKVWGSYPDAIARHNAEQIARYIQGAIEQDDPLLANAEGALIEGTPGDFMILTRNTARLSVYAKALAERGIPYTVAGGKDAGTSEELQGWVDALACVLRPDDPVARVAYLRGPLVGLSDAELYRIKRAYEAAGSGRHAFDDAAFRVPGAVADALEPELANRLQNAYALLDTAREAVAHKRPAVALHEIAERAGLFARALHHEGEASLRAGRLYRILDEVRHLDSQGLHWSEILKELEDILTGEREVDGMTLETGRRDSVRLLNVHKAKGLQANVVFLADPYDRYYSPSPTSYVQRRGTDRQLIQPVCDRHANVKYAPVGWEHQFSERAKRDDRAEEHRLQYVAATRAKRLLVVSRYAGTEDKGFWADLYPHLDAAEAPELEVPDEDSEADSEEPPIYWRPDLSGARARRRAAIEAGQNPSYRDVTVTDEAHEDALTLEEGGRGRDFGSLVHAVMEIVNSRRSSAVARPVVEALAQQHLGSVAPETVRQVLDIIDAWTASALWTQLGAAEEVHAEMPVATVQSGAVPTLQRGVIDLIFKAPDGWVIVDFKTDRIASEEALRQRVAHYAPQLRAYAEAWATQTGTAVHQAGLWFTEGGTWRPIELTVS